MDTNMKPSTCGHVETDDMGNWGVCTLAANHDGSAHGNWMVN